MHICLFEDINFYRLEPLIFNRPVFDLLCGTMTLKEKITCRFNELGYSLHCRKYLQDLTRKNNPGTLINEFPDDDCLLINGRVLPENQIHEILDQPFSTKKAFIQDGQIVAAFIPKGEIMKYVRLQDKLLELSDFEDFSKAETGIRLINYLWDIITLNADEITNDFILRQASHKKMNYLSEIPGYVHVVNEELVFIEENVVLKPGVVLDAEKGPVYIERDAIINSNSVIEGPAFIGESSIVKSQTCISSGVTLGKVCKAGGEIENSVLMPYTNKQHNGFLGSSYLGSWVNIGAGTNNSSLKNNYGEVRIRFSGDEVNTGLRFLGLLMGDHSKAAINTMFNTGTVVGFSSNIFGDGFPPKFIPSFSWGGAAGLRTYDINKSIETAKVVTERRKVEFTQIDEKLFNEIFSITGNVRD